MMRIIIKNIFSLPQNYFELKLLRPQSGILSFSNRSYSNVYPSQKEKEMQGSAPAAEVVEPLVDSFGRRHNYLRISLTERCNLRCQYCMPAEGVALSGRAALLSRGELARLARVFVRAGVRKVRLTGGEPTLRADLCDVVRELRGAGVRSVALTTNGLVLTRRLPALQRAGLAALNVSLDSLRAERYERMARRAALPRVLAGVDLALQLGYRPVKINVVLIKGFNDDEICDFVEWTRDRHLEVRFIEFMPFSGNKWDDSKLVPYREALRAVFQRYPHLAPEPPRDNDTATVWRVPEYAGTVGFIHSMTQHFCSSCNRLRLTADGNLKVCLFGAAEVSLRDALRAGASDLQLDKLVRNALANKKPSHAARRAAAAAARRRLRCHSVSPGAGSSHLYARNYCTAGGAGPTHLYARNYCTAGGAGPTHLYARNYCTAGGAGPTHLYARNYCTAGGAGPTHLYARNYCTAGGADGFSHLDAEGRARMVDVSDKPVTRREAVAECSLQVGARLLRLLRDARLPKGDALTVAQLAGALGAKRTAELIPLCHPLALECVRVHVALPRGACAAGGALRVRCAARVTARTGADMEALTGAAVAALALYDMCKSVDRAMRITDLRLVHKSGGRSGDYSEQPPAPPLRPLDAAPRDPRDPHDPHETYAPTNVAYF